MSFPTQSDHSSTADLTVEPYNCSLHSIEWHLLCQSGLNLCIRCAQEYWTSEVGSDAKRRQLLSEFDSALKNSCGQMGRSFTKDLLFSLALMRNMSRLLFHSDSHIQSLAQNCLKQLLPYLSDEYRNEIYSDIIQKIISVTDDTNEWALDLVSDLFKEQPIQLHSLKGDLNSLILWIKMNFSNFDDGLKSSALRSLVKLYEGSKRFNLFGLEDDLHLSHLDMALMQFEEQNDCLIHDSILLLKQLTVFPSVRNTLLEDRTPIKYFGQILLKSNNELKINFIDWFCQLIEEDFIGTYLVSDSIEDIIESLLPLMELNNPGLISSSFECLNLILGLSDIQISSFLSHKLTKHIIQTLNLSDRIAETTLFKSSLAAMKYVIEKNPSNGLFDEFDFYSVLDLLENCFSDCELFELILKLLFKMFDISIIPKTIPSIRLNTILEKVLNNIPKPSPNRMTPRKYILMASDCIKLIESILKLINFIKESELLREDKTSNLVGIDETINLSNIEVPKDIADDPSKQLITESEVTKLLRTCLFAIERFMTESLGRLVSDIESSANIDLLIDICSCLKVLIANDLLIPEDISSFIKRMFSNGLLLSIYQLILLAKNPIESDQLLRELSSILSIFLVSIQQFEYKDEIQFDFGEYFSNKQKHYESQIFNSNATLNRISQLADNKTFYETFFAMNYFLFKFDSSAIESIHYEYKQKLLQVLNHYLYNYLSDDSDSVPIVKHCLFLSSFVGLEDINFLEKNCWKQFFTQKDTDFVAKYYTNNIRLVHWFFRELDFDNLCEYVMRTYLTTIGPPDDFEKKKDLLSLFSLINSNERALRIFIKMLCDIDFAEDSLEIINEILTDSDMLFINDAIEFEEWKTFCDKVFEQMPKILIESMKHVRSVLSPDRMCPIEEKNVIKLVSFISRLLVTDRNICDELFQLEFHQFIRDIILLIDEHLSDKSLEKIFQFLKKCYISSGELYISEKSLTEDLLNSKVAVISIVMTIDNDSVPNEAKETSVYLLSKISENKIKYGLDHRMSYDLDICRMIELMNCKMNRLTIESAFRLFNMSIDFDNYFASNDKTREQKVKEIRALVFWCLNNVFINTIELSEYSLFFRSLLNSLDTYYPELKRHFLNHPLNETFINNLIKENEDNCLNEDIVDFFVMICRTGFVNEYTEQAIHKITERLVKFIECRIQAFDKNETEDISTTDNKSIDLAFNLIKKIDSQVCERTISKEMRVKLQNMIEQITSKQKNFD